ncbi:ATP-binding protein [Prauserella endophytica]|uniref:ATP-binding protein n=1 Tax=Prauserella endophytica TaxID=1592324 RepID=UPI00130538FF|nr:ATP-binding protein [Prauserella endophytica]
MSMQARDTANREPSPLAVSCDLDTMPTRDVRQLVRRVLAGRDGIVADDAVLVVDELVSNAHRHARGPRTCRLGLVSQGRRLRIEVDDASLAGPRMRTPDRSGGRGLVLVDQLASSWGVQHHADHKTVWAEVSLDGASSSRGPARHLSVAPIGQP